jgi:malate dehydrogenase
MKVTVIGAGNVGATCADVLAYRQIADEIVLLDIRENFAEGKVLDIYQTSSMMDFKTKLVGSTNDYSLTAGSDVIVITSGIPRKPGMTREELIGTNANIVKSVTLSALKHSPDAVVVVISNPMDTMTYLTLKASGLDKHKVIGMGGILDSARFKGYLAKALNMPTADIDGTVIGGHGDTTMIPLTRLAAANGIPVSQFLSADQLKQIAADTMVGGATLTKMLGTSAWYAPGAAGALLVESIVRDQKRIFPCCVALDGEYGQKDICLGVPVVIGRKGWEKIIDYSLNAEEQEAFNKSAEAVRNMNAVLNELSVF